MGVVHAQHDGEDPPDLQQSMLTCSYCGKQYDEATPSCSQCGKPLREDPADAEPRQVAGEKLMLQGALFFFIGLAATVFSYSEAPKNGGKFSIAIGAIIFGLAQFFRGRHSSSGRFSAKVEG